MNKVCYLGDYDLTGAAIYLAGIMSHFGIDYDHVPSTQSPADDFQSKSYALYVISDYPKSRFHDGNLEHIAQCVENGSGLLMLGGWESYHGKIGEYDQTILAKVLPVNMLDRDDRRCSANGVFVTPRGEHEITAGLPWCAPPSIVGYNEFTAKDNAQVLLEGTRFDIRFLGEEVEDTGKASPCPISTGLPYVEQVTVALPHDAAMAFRPVERLPMLVVGQYGKGRTAAMATDVAPHWVGGLVDWGPNRLTEPVADDGIEVGDSYAILFSRLVKWTANMK